MGGGNSLTLMVGGLTSVLFVEIRHQIVMEVPLIGTTAPTAVRRWMEGKTMVVDIGEVKRHIKPKADSTLRNMRKDDLIEYIRCLENNYNVAVSFNENQARYIESLGITEVVRCKDCKHSYKSSGSSTRYRCECWGVYDIDCEVTPEHFCSYGERKDNG